MKVSIRTVAGIVGITAALVWSVRGVVFSDVLEIISNADLLLAGVVLFLTVLNLVIRAAVWKAVVRPMKVISVFNAFTSYLIGTFSNLFLPFKLGDVAQGYSLGRRAHISKISSVSAVLVQRVFEVTSLILVMALVGAVFSLPLIIDRRSVILGVLVLLSLAGLATLVVYKDKVVLFLEKQIARVSPRVASSVRRSFELFIEGTRAIHNLSDITRILLLSVLSWAVQIVMVLFMTRSLNIQLDFISSAIVLLVINIGLLLPVAPGNIGTFQFFSIIALSFFSVPKPQALTFAVLFQVVQGIPVIIGGAFSMLAETVRLRPEPVKVNRKNHHVNDTRDNT
ncbi:MAG: lysylphosphatidylglycerol synthase transmembrane domain-containing protein [Chitinispirillaceae bacterium]